MGIYNNRKLTIPVFEVEFDGIDKCGKDTLVHTMFKVFPNVCAYQARGLQSQIAYSKLYGRDWSYPVTEGYVSNLLSIYLDVDEDDWIKRLKDSNEIENNKNRSDVDFVSDYKKHKDAFEYAWNTILSLDSTKNYQDHFLKINTSQYSPQQIAEIVADRIKKLNNIF